MSQHFDAIEYLAVLFAIAMSAIFGIGWWISEHRPRRRNRRHTLPPPYRDERDSIQSFQRMTKT